VSADKKKFRPTRKAKQAALVLSGRCMAHELEKRGIRLDLVEAWRFSAKAVADDAF